jgi:hypothetical protein
MIEIEKHENEYWDLKPFYVARSTKLGKVCSGQTKKEALEELKEKIRIENRRLVTAK